jgi:hypothetical protein
VCVCVCVHTRAPPPSPRHTLFLDPPVTFAHTATAPLPEDLEEELADLAPEVGDRYGGLLRGWWAAARRHPATPNPRLGAAVVQGLTAP